jgi:hypothetical protein
VKLVCELPVDAILRLHVIRKMLDLVPYDRLFSIQASAANRTAGDATMKNLRSFVDKKIKEFNEGNLVVEDFGQEVEGEAESQYKEAFLNDNFIERAVEIRKDCEVLFFTALFVIYFNLSII